MLTRYAAEDSLGHRSTSTSFGSVLADRELLEAILLIANVQGFTLIASAEYFVRPQCAVRCYISLPVAVSLLHC
jgi:hypothetical protein